jgi:hypothetical protein
MFLLSCSENCQAIFLAKFDGEAFLRCIEKYRANCAMVVPPIMVFLAKTPLFDKYDLSSLKVPKKITGNFSPSFKFKICQKFKTSQAKVINYHLPGDFCLADFKFKIR